jgi:hypothetical protein
MAVSRRCASRVEGGDNVATRSRDLSRPPDCRQERSVPARPLHAKRRVNTMQTRRAYQVQLWPNGQWSPQYNWRKVEAASAKEAAEKLCGAALVERGRHAQLRARVLAVGDFRQRSATAFYAPE